MTTSSYLPDVKVEIAFDSGFNTPAGSRTWIDVSQWVEGREAIQINFGRADERTVADANQAQLTLDNVDGRFTANRPASPYYPDVKIGRPLRITSTTTGNMLTPNQASVETSVADWSFNTAFGLYTLGTSLAQSAVRAWHGTKSLLATWSASALGNYAVVTSGPGLTIGETYTFSAYCYVPTGSPSVRAEVAFVSGSALMTTKNAWTRVSTTFVATATSHIFGIYSSPSAGATTCYIDAVMVSVGSEAREFTTVQPTSFVDFLGYIDEWPLEWEDTDAYAKARISASSRLSRLGQSNAKFRSVVEEEILLDAPTAYYTMGEPTGATKANDSSNNSMPTLFQVGGGTAVTFGSATGPGTDGLTAATFAGGKHLYRGEAFSVVEPSITLAIITSTVSQNVFGFDVTTGALPYWIRCSITAAGKLQISRESSVGAWSITGATTVTDGLLHVVSLVCGSAATTLYVDSVSDATTGNLVTPALRSLRVGNAYEIALDSTGTAFTGTIAHFALFDSTLSPARIASQWTAMGSGFAFEYPGNGITRFASYAGIPSGEVSAELGTTLLSLIDPTGKSVVEAMRIIESTESGVLFDAPDNTLTFHDRNHRYAATVGLTLDMDLQQIENGYSPRLDRSSIINDVTATTIDETTSVHVVNASSVADYGTYEETLELATVDTEAPAQAAGWRVNVYGEPSVRVPSLEVNVAVLDSATQLAILGATVGTRMQVINHPAQAQASTADYFIEGYTKTITSTTYSISFNNSPADAFIATLMLDSATRGLLDTNVLAY